jgi:hypothetical protein
MACSAIYSWGQELTYSCRDNSALYVDGKEVFLSSGEFHYWYVQYCGRLDATVHALTAIQAHTGPGSLA